MIWNFILISFLSAIGVRLASMSCYGLAVEGSFAKAIITRDIFRFRAPFEVTVSLEKYIGPLEVDQGTFGDTGMNYC